MKPASRYIAKAIPVVGEPGCFYAQFASPGLIPLMVRPKDGDRSPSEFKSVEEAENAARKALLDALTNRVVDTRTAGGYRRMSGAELAVAIEAADLTPTHFAELYGVPQARVLKWLDGEQDIPHSAHVLIKLLVNEKNYEMAEEITEWAQVEGEKG